MKVTTGGHRAHAFESIEAASKGQYFDTCIYVVEGLPGFWRRVKLPKGDAAEQGLLLAFFVDGIIALEHASAVTAEFEQAADAIAVDGDEAATAAHAAVNVLTDKRTDYLMRERNKSGDGAPVAEPEKSPEHPAVAPHATADAGGLEI